MQAGGSAATMLLANGQPIDLKLDPQDEAAFRAPVFELGRIPEIEPPEPLRYLAF